MIVYVRVKPGSKIQRVERISEKEYLVELKEKAQDGKANRKLTNLLAKEFRVTVKDIKIKSPKSRKKIVEIIHK